MNVNRDRHDAIVVLGGMVEADGTLAPWVAARVERALEAYGSGISKRVVFAGRSGLYGPAQPAVTEAAAMAAYAQRRGLPAEAVVLEEKSRDTLGNAYFVRRDILQPNGWRSIRVVTNDFHLSRAAWVFRKVLGPQYDFSFTSAPSGFSTDELIVRALDECRVSVFLNEWLATVEDGDEASVDSIMRHHHPAHSDAPVMSADEMERRLSEIARINRIEGTAEWLPRPRP